MFEQKKPAFSLKTDNSHAWYQNNNCPRQEYECTFTLKKWLWKQIYKQSSKILPFSMGGSTVFLESFGEAGCSSNAVGVAAGFSWCGSSKTCDTTDTSSMPLGGWASSVGLFFFRQDFKMFFFFGLTSSSVSLRIKYNNTDKLGPARCQPVSSDWVTIFKKTSHNLPLFLLSREL